MVKKKKYNWAELRKEFMESDLTYSAFSNQKGFTKSTSYTHLKDLISVKKSTNYDNTTDAPEVDNFDFLPVEILEAEAKANTPEVTFIKTAIPVHSNHQPDSSPIEIKIKGCSITLNAGFDKPTLMDALEVLTELC